MKKYEGEICHPRSEDEEVVLTSGNAFAAFGHVDRRKHPEVRCVLVYPNGDTVTGSPLDYDGQTPKTFWAVAFEDVEPNQECEVQLQNARTGKVIQSVSVTTRPPSFDTSITYPAQDATINQSFTAYGGTTGTITAGTMKLGSGNPVGQSGISQNGNNWFLNFTVPIGNGYTLTVYAPPLPAAPQTGLDVI